MAKKFFEMIDIRTGKLAFAGSAIECRDFLGIRDVKQIYNAVYRAKDSVYKGFCFVEHDLMSTEDDKAIRAWDDFTEPLRRKFGVPRYKGAK